MLAQSESMFFGNLTPYLGPKILDDREQIIQLTQKYQKSLQPIHGDLNELAWQTKGKYSMNEHVKCDQTGSR